jgi:transposase
MSNGEVLVGPERRRRWTAAEKSRVVEATLTPGVNVAEVARQHGLHPNQLHVWRRQARSDATPGSPRPTPRFAAVEIATLNAAAPAENSATSESAPFLIEIVLCNGRVLRVPESVAPSYVARLATALDERGR